MLFIVAPIVCVGSVFDPCFVSNLLIVRAGCFNCFPGVCDS